MAAIGIGSVNELFADIPPALAAGRAYRTLPPHGQCEAQLQQTFAQLAARNTAGGFQSFLGGGAYPRFIPAAVNAIASRSEFYTAYTPYQPEISQGTLQAGFEFQSMIAALTAMDAANATVYDGAVAVAEAALMALRITRRARIAVTDGLHPDYRAVLQTYLNAQGTAMALDTLDATDIGALAAYDASQTAAVVVQHPDYYGRLTSASAWAALENTRKQGALRIVVADPVSLGLLQAPGDNGADIVVGDMQPLGNPMHFGGPSGGYMACKKAHMRQLPGRLIGKTHDAKGRPCYTLTLQTREQHIRRDKAASNICTNQALNALRAAVYLALMGPQGLREVAERSVQRAHTLARTLTAIPGVTLRYPDQPFFSEFVLRLDRPVHDALRFLQRFGILGGIALTEHDMLVSATELSSPEAIAQYGRALAQFSGLSAQAMAMEGSAR